MDRKGVDTSILMLAVVLTCFGVVMVYSSSSIMATNRYSDGFFFLKRQGVFALLGFMVMAGASLFDYRHLKKLAVPGLILCMLLLIAVQIPGVGSSAGGATRWIRLGPVNVQPSELTKLALVVYMAYSLPKKGDKLKSLRWGFIPYILVLAILLFLLLLQPDLGSAMTLGGVAMIMLLVAGTRITYLFSMLLLAVPFLYYAVMNVDYRRKRIMTFLDPWADPHNSGFQIIQSWIAFGSGGLFGNGLGEGKQKLFYLPEAHTDFILSVIGEELGFVGVIVVAAIFLMFVVRGLGIAMSASDEFGCHLAFGITLLIGIQAFVNIGVVMGLLPTKGLALPFLSYGGTNLLTTLLAVGILLNISRQAEGGEK